MLDYFDRGDPYKNYNLDVEDEGAFWFGVANPDLVEDPASWACSADLPQWVENGETPQDEPAISPEVLAEAAYEWLPLPRPRSPSTRTPPRPRR